MYGNSPWWLLPVTARTHTIKIPHRASWDSSDCILKYPEGEANPKRKRTKKIWEWMESSQLTSAFEWSNGRNSESQQVTAAWRSSHNVERTGRWLNYTSLLFVFPSLTSGNMIKTMTSKSLTRKEHPYSSSKKSVLGKGVYSLIHSNFLYLGCAGEPATSPLQSLYD